MSLERVGMQACVKLVSIGVYCFDLLAKIGVRSTNEDCSIFSCDDSSAATLCLCFESIGSYQEFALVR